MKRAFVFLALSSLLLAGCTTPGNGDLEPGDGFGETRPADGVGVPQSHPENWNQTVELVFISGFRAHSADEQRSLVPPNDTNLAPPAYCVAYQDGEKDSRDSCTVVAPYDPDYWEEDYDWGIEASWDGRGEDLVEQEQDQARRTVVAYDAADSPVAYWDTAAHPNAAMAVE